MPEDSTPDQQKKLRPDHILQDAIEQTLEIALETIDPVEIGEYLGHRAESERMLTHFFDCKKPGYVGWHWAVTVSRLARSRKITVCEIDLLPGKSALLAPQWVLWEERLEPGDVSPDDVLPYRGEDDRLTLMRDTDQGGDKAPLSRLRTLSERGVAETKRRWNKSTRARSRGPKTQADCSSCGFLVSLEGELRSSFGVCANEWSNDDGRLVSLKYTCGAHSETDIQEQGEQWPVAPTCVNELDLEIINSW